MIFKYPSAGKELEFRKLKWLDQECIMKIDNNFNGKTKIAGLSSNDPTIYEVLPFANLQPKNYKIMNIKSKFSWRKSRRLYVREPC